MQESLLKRLVKRLLDATLVPLVRYAFDPIVAKLILQSEQTAANLRSYVEQATREINQNTTQFALLMSSSANDRSSSANDRLRTAQPILRNEIAQLRARLAAETPENPCIYGFKAYAQTDEDGIVANILDRLTGHSRTFIEIGCGNGIENNTHYLALKGYRGCWVDGSADNIGFIKDALGGLEFKDLLVQQHFITRDNIGSIIDGLRAFIGTDEPGFFSLDIDGNEFDVLAKALERFRPLVICAEYNAKFPPPLVTAMRYNPSHSWAGDDYHGASLQALCNLLTDYKLVACNLSGANAFFVLNDHAMHFADYTPHQLYQPFREDLIELRGEHRPSLKWLRDRLH